MKIVHDIPSLYIAKRDNTGGGNVRASKRCGAMLATILVLGQLLAACAAQGGAATSTGPGNERPPTFRVGLIPNIAPDRQKALYEPFREYLSKALNQPVETFVATDYTGVVEAMASDKIDLAYFGGLTYLQTELRASVYPIVTEIDRETSTSKYYSAIIVRSDSPYQKIEDLKGKKFAFGDINSTSSSLYPRWMLDQAGFSDFFNPQMYVYAGGHDAVLAAVVNASVEGGGIEKRIMERLFEAGTYSRDQIRIIQQAEVQGYPWVVRSKLDPALVASVTDAFLNIDNPELLRLMRAVKYTKVTRDDYDEPRREADRLGLRKK